MTSTINNHDQEYPDTRKPSLLQAAHVWLKIGLLSFGGPAAQIALMHRLVVAEKGWLSEKQYLSALSFCMLLPGPEAMQLATYAGWRLHGMIGGFIAGLLFVLPGALVILGLGTLYVYAGNQPWVEALFLGVKAAVIIVVIEALLRVARKALTSTTHKLIAALAFIGLFFLDLPFPLIIVLAAVFGYLQSRHVKPSDTIISNAGFNWTQSFNTTVWFLVLWLAPFMVINSFGTHAEFLNQLGAFFSKLAVVTFGGAYAVLAYLAQDVVTQFGWLTAGEMMDGLGLAETTPGPLILVTEFVGFLAGFREGGFVLALVAAVLTLWVTFIPCFLWIFLGAPYLEWISEQPRLKGALQAITAAVVGVILNLSVWFALHVLFKSINRVEALGLNIWIPDWQTLDIRVVALTVFSGFTILVLHWGIARVLIMSALLGLASTYLF